MSIHHTHLRIARPTRDLIQIRRFYTEGLGMSVLYEGGAQINERRWELVMCGFENAEWHLEFTRVEPHSIVPTPTVDDLLVLYLGDQHTVESTISTLEQNGGTVVPSDNPYWDAGGLTVEDPDGYRVVLTAREWRKSGHDAGLSHPDAQKGGENHAHVI